MSTVAEGGSKVALDSAQSAWLKKMGDALKVPIRPDTGGDIPLTGVFPEIIWEQKQSDVKEAESMVVELEGAEMPNAPLLRKGMDRVHAYANEKKYAEANKAFDDLQPKIKAEHERLMKSRLGGVRDIDGGNRPVGKLDAAVEGVGDRPGAAKGKAAAKPSPAAPPAPAPTAGAADCAKYKKEILKVGSKGPAVECLQKILGGGMAADGKFGPATQKAVKAFQKSKGLKDDGVVGPKTWEALAGGAGAGAQGGAGGGGPAGDGKAVAAETTHKGAGTAGVAKSGATVKAGAGGAAGFISASVGKGGKNNPADVKVVQEALNQRGGAKLNADGKFGPPTLKAIEDFQRKLGQFKPDGLIEPKRGTARALSGAAKIPPTPPEPKPIAPPVLGKATLDKGAFVWNSTRGILDTNIKELKKGVRAAYGTEHADLLKAIDDSMVKLGKVVDKLDTRLADALDAAYKAPSDEARIPELKNAESIMKEYLKYVKAEPLIGHMDNNPFGVQTSLMKVITDALKHLSQLLPEAAVAKS